MGGLDVPTSLTLVNGLRDPGNGVAWRTFLERYQALIGEWCRGLGLSPSDAEEVSAAVLAKLVEGVRSFDPARRFRPWLRTVVRNEALDLYRRRRRRPGDWGSGDSAVQAQLEGLEAREDDLAGLLEEEVVKLRQAARRIAAAVRGRVQAHTWQAFELLEAQGLPVEEAGRRLGMSIAAVYKARQRVARLLREEGQKQGRAGGAAGEAGR
jgi:RNA polymerase sigma-70 factor (ECF subfamily)